VGKEKNVEKGGKSAKYYAKSLPMSKGVGKVFTHQTKKIKNDRK
jgi:hypothetical protein